MGKYCLGPPIIFIMQQYWDVIARHVKFYQHINNQSSHHIEVSRLFVFYRIATSAHCVKSVQIQSFVWFVISCIQTEYGDLLRIQ